MNSCIFSVFGPILMVSTLNNFSKALVLEIFLPIKIGSGAHKLFKFKVVKVFKDDPVYCLISHQANLWLR